MSGGLLSFDLPPLTNGNGNGNGIQHAAVHKMPSTSTFGMDSDEDENLNFDSPEDEIAHYREKYRQALDMLTETRAELEEFQQSSKELEDEMEQELASNEKQQAELKEKIKRLETEKEDWKSKQIALQKMHSSTTSAMQREMDNLRSERDKTLVALRDLEMGNDELERNERVAVSSLLDLESKYNRAIEEKTLLEQEVIQNQELEEESQRLKDELRDANSEITILKDQLKRAVPPPPVSRSAPMSPVQEASHEMSRVDVTLSGDPDGTISAPPPPPPPAKSPLSLSRTPDPNRTPSKPFPRSATSSSIPTLASPAPRRYTPQSGLTSSPSALSALSRSTTSRNLAGVAGPASPALTRSRSGIPTASPARVATIASNQQTKSRGFKLLHDLQARLKATDDKLGAKVPKRNVSNPLSFGSKSRNVSTSSTASNVTIPAPSQAKAAHARVTQLAKDGATTPAPFSSDKANGHNANLMSPNGWVLIEDGAEGEDTPTGPGSMTININEEPQSPLELQFRAVSSASTSSNRSLPTRPGIPSPLANASGGLNRSTSTKFSRPSSRAGLTSSTLQHQRRESSAMPRHHAHHKQPSSDRPMSPSMIPTSAASSRPMSPSMLPQLTRSMRAPSPAFGSIAASLPSSTASSRPPSRTEKAVRAIGRGPPPPQSVTATPGGMRRSSRRSSLGAAEASLPPTGIPAPSSSATRTPGRPTSVHVFGSTPPPVPRIPSAHLRESARKPGVLGRDRAKTTVE